MRLFFRVAIFKKAKAVILSLHRRDTEDPKVKCRKLLPQTSSAAPKKVRTLRFRLHFNTDTGDKELLLRGDLFEKSVKRLIQCLNDVVWQDRGIAGILETKNPPSKWKLTSHDLRKILVLEQLPAA